MQFDFLQILPSVPFIVKGALVTLQYTSISIFLGLILGCGIAISHQSSVRSLRWFVRGYTSIFRGTPLLLQLALIYYSTPQLLNYQITVFEAGILTFSLNSSAYISEIIRAGIQAVNKGQMEAALSLGIPPSMVMKDIILPQAFKNILPALVNEMIDLLKESAIISVLGEMDLLRRARIVSAEKYLYFEPLMVAASTYYIMVLILTYFAKRLEKRLQKSD